MEALVFLFHLHTMLIWSLHWKDLRIDEFWIWSHRTTDTLCALLPSGSSAVVRYDHAESQDDQLWPTKVQVADPCLEFLPERGEMTVIS